MKTALRSGILVTIVILLITFLLFESGTQNSNALIQAPLGETNPDAEMYAEHMGLSLDEALGRFRIMDGAGILQADMSVHEADTFAGLWIEHSPEFQVVVLFTKSPSQKIEPYLRKEYMTPELAAVLDVRRAKISLAELEQVHAELISSLTDLRIRFELELNMIENNIRLGVGEDDKTSFDLAVQNGLLQVPDYVIIETIPQLGKIEPSLGNHFPQTINPPNAYLGLPLLEGKLVLENGCLRVNAVNDSLEEDSFLLIWDPRFSTRTENGIVQVIDSTTGEVLAGVGDSIVMGDNGNTVNPLKESIPDECTEPYKAVGEFIRKIDRP